jgi:hypothetical protein
MIYASDGVLSAADTSGTIGTTADKVWFGRSYFSTVGSQYVKKLLVVPRRVSNGDLPTFGVA